jgi:hypothetical protein
MEGKEKEKEKRREKSPWGRRVSQDGTCIVGCTHIAGYAMGHSC